MKTVNLGFYPEVQVPEACSDYLNFALVAIANALGVVEAGAVNRFVESCREDISDQAEKMKEEADEN